jgi:hypothetical protein
VYGRDNRLKVVRDEAKAKEAEDEASKKHQAAEAEHRRSILIQRARGSSGQAGDGKAIVEDKAIVVQEETVRHHINFWRDDETKAENPEVKVQSSALPCSALLCNLSWERLLLSFGQKTCWQY